MLNILVIYYHNQFPIRTTIKDHLYCFQRYSNHRFYYINIAFHEIDFLVRIVNFDLVIFHTIFLSQRWDLSVFSSITNQVKILKHLDINKIVIPQDEFIHTDVLCQFINEFNINCIFSVAPESEWHKIYNTVDFKKVQIFKVLTGYLDDRTLHKIEKLSKLYSSRPIDIGYRAWKAEYWLGKHGFLKTKIAEIFQEKVPQMGISVDISTQAKDTLLGDDWYKFLLKCKYTIGVEGGASILDRYGDIREKVNEYINLNPQATFEETEAMCFPNLDSSLSLFAISPRHLEACVTKTCQILIEGEYNGILKEGKHYIKLNRDFSNISEVIDIVKNGSQLTKEITKIAYNEIVESRLYTYNLFVDFILDNSLNSSLIKLLNIKGIIYIFIWLYVAFQDYIFWLWVKYKLFNIEQFVSFWLEIHILRNFYRLIKFLLPKFVFRYLSRVKKQFFVDRDL